LARAHGDCGFELAPRALSHATLPWIILVHLDSPLSTKIVFGFRTLWAYFREYDAFKASGKELNQVNPASLEARFGFDLNWGSF
jgi:hypothetical protein